MVVTKEPLVGSQNFMIDRKMRTAKSSQEVELRERVAIIWTLTFFSPTVAGAALWQLGWRPQEERTSASEAGPATVTGLAPGS